MKFLIHIQMEKEKQKNTCLPAFEVNMENNRELIYKKYWIHTSLSVLLEPTRYTFCDCLQLYRKSGDSGQLK